MKAGNRPCGYWDLSQRSETYAGVGTYHRIESTKWLGPFLNRPVILIESTVELCGGGLSRWVNLGRRQ